MAVAHSLGESNSKVESQFGMVLTNRRKKKTMSSSSAFGTKPAGWLGQLLSLISTKKLANQFKKNIARKGPIQADASSQDWLQSNTPPTPAIIAVKRN